MDKNKTFSIISLCCGIAGFVVWWIPFLEYISVLFPIAAIVFGAISMKGLKKENLRDNMTTTEIVLNMLAETSTTDISKETKPQNFEENVQVARQGGEVAGIARQALEQRTGKPVITSQNAAQLNTVVTGMIEGVVDAEKKKDETDE